MINDLDIVQWGYLLDPAFQLVNSAGKPLTNGYIEVYYHGTRNKYYCASDFDGTLHPFKIPLDSLGSNIVLADPGYSYDIYIYNAFGSLVMSRYNVTPGKGGEGSGGGGVPGSEMPEHWLGMYGSSIQIPGTGAGTTLPVPTGDGVDYEGDFIDHIEDNKYIYLKEGLYLVECVIRFEQSSSDLKNELGEVLVYTGRGNANEDRAWQEDLSGPDANGNRHCLKMSFIRLVQPGTHHGDSSVLYFAPGSPVNWSWAQIQNLSIVKLEAGGGAAYKYLPGDYITIDNRTISVTGLLPESATAQFVTSDTLNETVTNIYNDIDYVSAAVQDCISGGVTHGELIAVSTVIEGDVQIVSAALNEVSAAIPEAQVNADWNATSGKAEILNKPDLSVYATEQELQNVSSTLDDKIDAVSAAVPEAQVNADWNATSGKAEILNKPDLTVYATHDEVAGATSVIENTIEGVSSTIINEVAGDLVTVSTVLEGDIQIVSAALDSVTAPEYQAGEGIDITDDTISLDNPISIEAGSGITFTATEDTITISADAPDLSNYATHDEVSGVVGAVSSVIEGDISAVSTEIMNIVEGVSATIEGDIQSVSTTIEGDISSVSTVLQNNIEGVSATIINEVAGDLVTVSTVLEGDIQTVSAALDAVTAPEYQAGEGIDITDDTISLDDPISIEAGQGITFSASGDTITISADAPDLSNYATHDEVSAVVGSVSSVIENDIQTVSTVLETVSANMPEPQVNSDWAAVSGVAEILNKPQNVDVIAGPGIQFTEVSGNIVISATVSGDVTVADLEGVTAQLEGDIQTVSSAIPDVSDLATKDELQAVSSAIPDISNLATEAELQIVSSAVDAVSAAIPEYVGENGVSVSGETISLDDPIGIVAGEGVTFTQDGDDIIISAEGDVSKDDLATVSGTLEGDIQTVSAAIPPAQVNSDWTANSGVAEILNKPTEVDVIAGHGVSIEETAQGVVISASGDVSLQDLAAVSGQLESDIQTVSSAIPDISNLATESELQTVSAAVDAVSAAIPDISNLATESELQTVSAVVDAVSAAIPGSQVQSDWTETDDTKKSYIQHKPSAKTLVAGSNITISESASSVTISSTGGQGDVTIADLVAVSGNLEGDIQTVSSAIPEEQELIAGTGISITVQNNGVVISANGGSVTGVVTEAELAYVSGQLEGDIQTVSAAIPPAQVNANWNETSSSSKAYIQNKPTTLAPFNTAGITDIQYVNALPANPVSSVIYIIPET